MKLKVVQYGVGKMSKYTMRYVMEKGGEIVAAFDSNPKKVGLDIGKIMESDDCKIYIQSPDNFANYLTLNKPDIVIVTTMSLLSDVAECLIICAKCGVNAITTCEEAFFPQNSNPELFEKIDMLARQNNCTISATGYQDVFWGNLISVIAGATHKITKIIGRSSYNVEDYGIALARAHGAGLSLEDFNKTVASADNISETERNKLIQNSEFLPSYMWNVNGWLAGKLGLTITSQKQECIPEIATESISSTTLGVEIEKGHATGMSAVVTSTTKEGIVITTKCVGKVYSANEFDANEWTIEGEPNTTVIINRPQTIELTCATTVNRLADVIASPSGFYTTEKMEEPRYNHTHL